VYAITKLNQELICMSLGREFKIPVVALRYHNVYGPRMPRDTPYAGVASIFKSRLLAGLPPILYEDGKQLRDFIHVDDIVQANLLAADAPEETVAYEAFNVGTGHPRQISDFAMELAKSLAPGVQPEMPGTFRFGDIRHVFADISKIQEVGFRARVSFEEGVARFAHEPPRARPTLVFS
jgi:dTDP-L-rhamnose 4-epimerase